MTKRKRLALVFGGGALLLAAIVGGIYVYRKLNYETVVADVLAIEDSCLLRRGSSRGRASREYGPMRCEEARRRDESGDYPNFDVVEISRIEVSYRSPADGRVHEGELRASRDTYKRARRGDQIDIRAHTSDPREILAMEGL